MKPRIKKQVFSLALALSLSFGMTEPAAKLTLAATNGADKLYSAKTDKIDIYKKNKKPNARNYKADWNSKIFYTLEDIDLKSSKDGQLKKYKLVRKELINKKNGNRIEYEVYKHPKTGKMHKITSIEHRKNDLEITDYYYDDKGKPNFIYQRKDSIYTPIYADFNRTGDRYFFNNDSLIKWRWVKKANDVEEITLKVDKGRKDVKQHGFSTVSKAKKKAYDKKEVNMLNAAYNTYKAMLKKSKKSIAKGYIVDAKRNPVANATVEFLRSNKVVGKVKTNSKGYYNTGVLPVKGGYTIRVSADGYQTLEGVKAIIDKTGAVIWIDVISLVPVSEASHKVSVNVYDGETVKYDNDNVVRTFLSGTEVIARRGVNNKTGEQVATGTTDGDGNLVIELISGVYTLEIRLNGYVVGYRTVTVDEDKNVSIALTKPVTDKQMKVVLSWEGEQDLDSYLFTPYRAKKGNMAYIGGSYSEDKHGNRLYLDGKNGNNVEIINIANIKNGYYKYYVSDYTNSITKNYSAKDMAGLNIRVEVYDKNGLVAVYIIPYNPNGVIWEVFEIKNGKVVPLQNTYKNVKNKKWWVEKKRVYETGEMVVPLKYDDPIYDFNEGLALVHIGDKCGYINEQGEEVVPLKYDYFSYYKMADLTISLDFCDGRAVAIRGNKFGYINKKGEEVIPLQYDKAYNFWEGRGFVSKGGKYSYINTRGEAITPNKYDFQYGYNYDNNSKLIYLTPFFRNGFAIVRIGEKFGLINKKGKEIVPVKYPVEAIGEKGISDIKLINKKIGDKWGYINKEGDLVVPAIYDYAAEFINGIAYVRIGNKEGYINENGKPIIPIMYDDVKDLYNTNLLRVTIGGKSGLINKKGKEIIPLIYDDIDFEVRDSFIKVKKDGKWGYMDENGKLVIPTKYDNVEGFYGGLSVVQIGNKYGYINKKDKLIVQTIYDKADSFKGNLAKIKLEDKYGYIDKKGKLVIPAIYDEVDGFEGDLATVKLGDKWGCINKKGKIVIPIKYDELFGFDSGVSEVKIGGK